MGGERTASTQAHRSFMISFLQNVVKQYISQLDYFSSYFLILGEYQKFVKIISQGLKDTYKQYESKDMGKSKIREKMNNDEELDIEARRFLLRLVNELSDFEERIGKFLGEMVESALKDQDKYNAPKIEKDFILRRMMGPDDIETRFDHQNEVILREGNINIEPQANPHNQALPAALIVESNLSIEEMIQKYMLDYFSPALQVLTTSEVEYERLKTIYESLVSSKKKWENQDNTQAKNNLESKYVKLKKSLTLLLKHLKSKNAKLQNDKNYIYLHKNTTSKERDYYIKKIDNVLKLNYQGKGFPSFPGNINRDHTRLLPPLSNSILNNVIVLPVIAQGWRKDNNTLLSLLTLEESLFELYAKLKQKNKFVKNSLSNINELFLQLKLDRTIFTLTNFKELLEILKTSKDPLRLYDAIISISSHLNLRPFSIKDNSNRSNLIVRPFRFEFPETYKVLVINNDQGTGKDGSWRYGNKSILPDFISAMLANSHTWPRKIETYVWNRDFAIDDDKTWDRNANQSLLRWIKSTIDGIVLYYITKKKQSFLKNMKIFSDIGHENQLLILPIIERNYYERSRMSQAHRYYYEVLETLKTLDEINEDKQVLYDNLKTTLRDKVISHYKTDFIKRLDYLFMNKIESNVQNTEFQLNINVQMFETIPPTLDFNALYKTWKKLLQSPLVMEKLLEEFNTSDQIYEMFTVYETDKPSQSISGNEIKFIPYIPKSTENRRILTHSLWGLLMLSIGKGELKKVIDKSIKSGENVISNFFILDRKKGQKGSVSKFPGRLVTNDLLVRVLNAASSLKRTDGTPLNYLEHFKKQANAVEDEIEREDFLTLFINPASISQGQGSEYESLINVLVIYYSINESPKIIFNENFLCDNRKNYPEYRKLIEKIIVQVLFKQKKLIITKTKNSPRSGKHTSEQSKSLNESVWNDFKHLSQAVIEEMKSITEFHKLSFWGYIDDFVTIPQFAFMKSNDPRLFVTEFDVKFKGESAFDESYNDYKVTTFLAVRAHKKNLERINKEVKEVELNTTNFYAHASALINFRNVETEFSEDQKDQMKDNIFFAASLGDEKGEFSLAGLKRLFYYPHPDQKKVYGPSLLLKGIDFFEYQPE